MCKDTNPKMYNKHWYGAVQVVQNNKCRHKSSRCNYAKNIYIHISVTKYFSIEGFLPYLVHIFTVVSFKWYIFTFTLYSNLCLYCDCMKSAINKVWFTDWLIKEKMWSKDSLVCWICVCDSVESVYVKKSTYNCIILVCYWEYTNMDLCWFQSDFKKQQLIALIVDQNLTFNEL